tara:strand:- start:116253 stop:117077 length:825 start_codon:yes stop_codon:yes gene_type:complete
MKKLLTIIVGIGLLGACNSGPKKSDRGIVLGDTITSKTGLKYIFLKEGFGRKIDSGSMVKVYTDLYLNDADTTIWKTSDSKDSVFSFIHKSTSLISGFTEIHNYLQEGDEVIAILPDSLAYGKRGRGIVPPGATLVYNPLVVKYVSEPKAIITDTIMSLIKNKSVKEALSFYEMAVEDKTTMKFHSDDNSMVSIAMAISRDSLYVQLEEFSDYFIEKSKDADALQSFYYGKILALENLGKIDEAIKMAKPLSEGKQNTAYWKNVLKSLEEKNKK